MHHFAFARACLLGLDLADSFARYLAWCESTTDLRHVQHRREALLKQIIEAGRALDGAGGEATQITGYLDLLRRQAPVRAVV